MACRIRMGVCIAAAVFLAALVPAPQEVCAHKYYASLAQMEWNSKNKVVEVSIRLFADDLEEAVTLARGRRVRFGVTPDADQYVAQYIAGAFSAVDRGGEQVRFSWVGMEVEGDTVWAYFESDAPAGLDGWTLRNTLLTELFPEQVNTVNIRQRDSRLTLTFRLGDTERAVAFDS